MGALAAIGGLIYVVASQSTITPGTTSQQLAIDYPFPTGDHIKFYLPTVPVSNLTRQLSTIPLVQHEYSSVMQLLGTDKHDNLIIQNGTNIVNSSSLSANETAFLKSHPQILQNMSTFSATGVSYGGQASANSNTAASPGSTSLVVQEGNTVQIKGKLIIVDPNTCKQVTQNGEATMQCDPVPGLYHYTMQILCIDTNAFRCSAIHDNLPTNRGITNPDSTFEQDWSPLPDPNYVGNYDAKFYFESETIDPHTGHPYDQNADFYFSIIK